jgi:U3 small nucleolar RNA-associated protein 10
LIFFDNRDEEQALPSSNVFKRRAQALIVYVEYALKSTSSPLLADSILEGGSIGDLTALLIHIATLYGTRNEKSVDALSQAARSCLSQAANVMSAADFVGALLAMLESGEDRVSKSHYRVTWKISDL